MATYGDECNESIDRIGNMIKFMAANLNDYKLINEIYYIPISGFPTVHNMTDNSLITEFYLSNISRVLVGKGNSLAGVICKIVFGIRAGRKLTKNEMKTLENYKKQCNEGSNKCKNIIIGYENLSDEQKTIVTDLNNKDKSNKD